MVLKELVNYVFPWHKTEDRRYKRKINLFGTFATTVASAGLGYLVSRLVSNSEVVHWTSAVMSAPILSNIFFYYGLLGDRYRKLNQEAVEPTHPDYPLLLERFRKLDEEEGTTANNETLKKRLKGVMVDNRINYHADKPIGLEKSVLEAA